MNEKIAITGNGGYIATHLKLFFECNGYEVLILDLLNNHWQTEYSLQGYDVLIHTSGLVHKNENDYSLEQYLDANTFLTLRVAEKAKSEGVKKFVFMSSESVYGLKPSIFRTKTISKNTPPKPKTKYGISKLEAEKLLEKIKDNMFSVLILRCPMVYGKDCPGNYSRLKVFIKRYNRFPYINNKRSFLHIDVLCYKMLNYIRNDTSGIKHPQNNKFLSTYDLVTIISVENSIPIKKMVVIKLFIFIFAFLPIVKKIFGNLIIDCE